MFSLFQGGASPWLGWALLSAAFAALTAIFAKVGVSAIHSDLATFIRTIVILVVAGLMVSLNDAWRAPASIPARTWLFLTLSGVATGLSWLCYFRALQAGPASVVAPVDKLSVVLTAIFAVSFLGERMSAKAIVGVALITIGVVMTTLK